MRELLAEGVCTNDLSMDGVNGGLSVVENDVAAVKASVSGTTGMYAVVRHNLRVIDKWTLQFEHDQRVLGQDVTVSKIATKTSSTELSRGVADCFCPLCPQYS